jgi:glycine/D-amino acid oxidase-like deaminating enzyme
MTDGQVGGPTVDVVIVGAGVFGCALAVRLARQRATVMVIEQEAAIFARASTNNQARVHRGYHYPRSLRTGLRSKANYDQFLADYPGAVDTGVESIYAIARSSRVTADQFRQFTRRIDVPLRDLTTGAASWFEKDLVEATFLADEGVFNARSLAATLADEMARLGVDLRLSETVTRLASAGPGTLVESTVTADPAAAAGQKETVARQVFVCAYAGTDDLLVRSGLAPMELRRQETEMELVRLGPRFANVGITVMDGPFFSLLPYPIEPGLHTLSHVRFTPQLSTGPGTESAVPTRAAAHSGERGLAFGYMLRDLQRYLPAIGDCDRVRTIQETKMLPLNLGTDGRPIMIRRPPELPGVTVVVGGKVDNVYDLLETVGTADVSRG